MQLTVPGSQLTSLRSAANALGLNSLLEALSQHKNAKGTSVSKVRHSMLMHLVFRNDDEIQL
jgi:hypothetical protein